MSQITKIEVETWTRDAENAGTDDPIHCIITFQDGRSFQQQLNNADDNFERKQHERFNLDLTTSTAAAAISNQDENNVTSIVIKKTSGSNMWKCDAIGLRINNNVKMSRRAVFELETAGSFITFYLRAAGKLDGIEIKITTGGFNGSQTPGTDDKVFAGLKFTDGTFQISDVQLYSMVNDFEEGTTYTYLLPLSENSLFDKTASDIDEFTLHKTGSNGWFLKSAHLYVNGSTSPIMGSTNINQFLDNDPEVLNIVSWSSKRITGPVLGYITDTTARVQYRVENEGLYRVELYQGGNLVTTKEASLNPTYIFTFSSLLSNTYYTFKFYRKVETQLIPIPTGDGSFRTSPSEGQGVKFSFGFGSCVRNGYDPVQSSWQQVKNISLDPTVDPLTQNPALDLRFFIHAGDTFYFYDDVANQDAALMTSTELLSTARAANLSSRLNANFLDMAKRVPTCAVWDDHDFRHNDKDSAGFTFKNLSKQTFLEYWANPTPFSSSYGLSTRMTYGNVDIYLLDGRYNRLHGSNQLFSSAQCDFIAQDIESRGPNRLPILLSGSTWNNLNKGDYAHYGDSIYDIERKTFYGKLNSLIANNKIKGLIFLSGDVHVHEIYQIELATTNTRVAPEIVCSPMGHNTGLDPAPPITGERKVGLASTNGQVGFASLHIDTTSVNPNNWTVIVNYRKNDGVVFHSKQYTLTNNQFIF